MILIPTIRYYRFIALISSNLKKENLTNFIYEFIMGKKAKDKLALQKPNQISRTRKTN